LSDFGARKLKLNEFSDTRVKLGRSLKNVRLVLPLFLAATHHDRLRRNQRRACAIPVQGREIERPARAAGANSVVSKHQAASELILQAQALLASIEQEHDPAKLPNAS
jgi:hypothetical protein